MSLENSIVTKYAIARNQKIISDGYDTIDIAKQQLAHVSEAMTGLGLEPDVKIVTVDVETKIGRPHVWKEDAAVEEEAGSAETDGTGEAVPPASA